MPLPNDISFCPEASARCIRMDRRTNHGTITSAEKYKLQTLGYWGRDVIDHVTMNQTYFLTYLQWRYAYVGNTDTEPISRYFQIPVPIPTSVLQIPKNTEYRPKIPKIPNCRYLWPQLAYFSQWLLWKLCFCCSHCLNPSHTSRNEPECRSNENSTIEVRSKHSDGIRSAFRLIRAHSSSSRNVLLMFKTFEVHSK